MNFYRRTLTICVVIVAATLALPTITLAAAANTVAFSQNFQLWDTSPDIQSLQQFLNAQGFTVAQTGAGSPGQETTTFGTHTYQALVKFQAAHNIPATGFFGPLTRAAVSSTNAAAISAPSPISLPAPQPAAGTSTQNCPAPPGLTCYPGTNITQPVSPGNGYTPGFGGGGSPPSAAAPIPAATADTAPPAISSIASSVTDTTATITWTTDESSNSKVTYGLTSAYGSASSSASLVTSHSTNLNGLTASTTYHYAVVSTDSSGNAGTSSDQTFTTYDAASQTLFAAMTTPPTTAFKSAADTLIRTLKSDSIWDDLDFLYLLPAGTEQAAYLNWKNPGTFTITPVYTDRPIFVPYRGTGSNGTNSNFRTGFTPSVNAVHGTLNNSSLWTWVSSATPDQNSVQEVGDSGSTATVALLVRSATDNARILLNDLNNGTASVTNTDGSGLFGVQRISSATKRLWRGNAQFGADIARASIAMADAEIYINGVNAVTFNTRQLQMAAYGANLAGKEVAFNNALNTFMQSVVPAATGGRFWTAGDSYMHGSGGTTNVSMASLLNYTTGRLLTDVSAGGTTLAQQRDAILARPDLYGLPLVWWDGLANGHVDTATDLAIVDQVLAVVPASQIILIPSVVVGPPSATTTATLSDMQAFRAGLIARGIHTIDMQSILVAQNNTGSDAASTAAGLVGPSLTQDGTHLIGSVMDQAVAQIVPLLSGI